MKKRQKLLTDEQWELVKPMLPPPGRRQDNRGRPLGIEPGVFRGDSVDSANRRGVAIRARRVCFPFDLLAATEAVGRRRGVAASVAQVAGGAG